MAKTKTERKRQETQCGQQTICKTVTTSDSNDGVERLGSSWVQVLKWKVLEKSTQDLKSGTYKVYF
jgi:hypothetical protein